MSPVDVPAGVIPGSTLFKDDTGPPTFEPEYKKLSSGYTCTGQSVDPVESGAPLPCFALSQKYNVSTGMLRSVTDNAECVVNSTTCFPEPCELKRVYSGTWWASPTIHQLTRPSRADFLTTTIAKTSFPLSAGLATISPCQCFSAGIRLFRAAVTLSLLSVCVSRKHPADD